MAPVTKILFISADPTDAGRLRLGEEMREIRERLQLSKTFNRFVLSERHCVRVSDLAQAMFDEDPNIVHFSGHGVSAGSIVLEDKNGAAYPVSPDALKELFELFADRVSCVVLNTCHSRVQAEAIVQGIRYVIGMKNTISDSSAINFSIGFL